MVSKKQHVDIPWHAPSEQPYVVPDRALKKRLQKAALSDHLKALGQSLWYAPIITAQYLALGRGWRPKQWARPSVAAREFMGMAVGLMSCPWQQLRDEIKALGLKHILLRIPAWELDALDSYLAFLESVPECEVVICIMQDRSHIINHELWDHALETVVSHCWPRVKRYQIGQGSNRAKWGFFSMGEFLAMANRAHLLGERYEGIELIGPGVLDFELIPAVRGLMHEYPIQWDAVASALYVDRRGSPRNKQMGIFDLSAKIRAMAAVQLCASRSKRRLWITETNWPLKGQGEYSPTSEHECVDEKSYDTYMQQYLIDAWRTQLVERVYWWQLVAKGYGLIDVDDNGKLRHRPAYNSFKAMLSANMDEF